jgi:hypothetical protein
MTEVSVNAHNPTSGHSIGIYLQTLAILQLRGSSLNISGDNNNYGIFSENMCIPIVVNSKISVTGGYDAFGVYNRNNSVATIEAALIEVNLAERWMYGVQNDDAGSKLNIISSQIVAGYAILNTNDGGDVVIDRTTLIGSSNSARNDNASADFLIGASKLVGPTSSNLTCAGVYDGTYSLMSNTCQ